MKMNAYASLLTERLMMKLVLKVLIDALSVAVV
jgi:hypothetical protein